MMTHTREHEEGDESEMPFTRRTKETGTERLELRQTTAGEEGTTRLKLFLFEFFVILTFKRGIKNQETQETFLYFFSRTPTSSVCISMLILGIGCWPCAY